MNFDDRYRTIWFRSCESVCRKATACRLALIWIGRKLKNVGYSKWRNNLGAATWTCCGCQLVAPLPPQHTPSSGLLPVDILSGWKYAHLRKSPYLVARKVVDFIRKRCSNIRKIYLLIKMVACFGIPLPSIAAQLQGWTSVFRKPLALV
jgi:hypothetical protein